jgi:hypothetical protein
MGASRPNGRAVVSPRKRIHDANLVRVCIWADAAVILRQVSGMVFCPRYSTWSRLPFAEPL